MLAFPCNEFGGQEPGTEAEIKEFVKKFGVNFPMFSKVKVNGGGAVSSWFSFGRGDVVPLYKFLKQHPNAPGESCRSLGEMQQLRCSRHRCCVT